jgi:T4-like virus tail tube protein gp19
MAFNVSQFTNQLVNDGARPNLFQVVLPGIPAPLGSNQLQNVSSPSNRLAFMAKAAQIPGSSIGQVPLYYFGREVKFAGNRTFADWTLTIINDEDFTIRTSLETWMNWINSNAGNVRGTGNAPTNTAGQTYALDATVNQYGKNGNVIQAYNFVGMFPIDISPIDLDWGSNDTIEEFTVTFAYQYWTNANSTDA